MSVTDFPNLQMFLQSEDCSSIYGSLVHIPVFLVCDNPFLEL